MKYLYLLLSIFFPLNFAIAQNISVGNISKPIVCTGDTVWVPYVSGGTFQADNFFAAQLSQSDGSFSTFTNIGHFTKAADSIPVVIGYSGNHFQVRIIATDPYTISSNVSSDIQVVNYPAPRPIPLVSATSFGYVGFVGDPIRFSDGAKEPSGSKYLWTFDQDANILWTTDSSPSISYSSTGFKSGHLTVENTAGCSASSLFQFTILSCNALIPDTAHVVTGTESGSYDYVWVKAGGSYTNSDSTIFGGRGKNIVFADPGASVTTTSLSLGTYYLKTGVSFNWNYNSNALVIVNKGNPISFKDDLHHIDILYCDNLQFDYSQVRPSDVQITENPLQIIITPNHLQVRNEGENISAEVVNLFGNKIFTRSDHDLLSLDLSNLPNGVYFAIITSGDYHEVRKIAVVH